MKIKYLGTAAAEGIPALLCECSVCEKSRALGGKNLRTRSQALVDGDMLIDMPPETFAHIQSNGINLLNIKHWLITHSHSDHFYPNELANTLNGVFAHHSNGWHGIDFHGSIDFKKDFDFYVSTEEHKKYIRFNTQKAFAPFKTGEYSVIPLKANHGTENPFIYSISKNGKNLLYAHDTGPFFNEVWDCLKRMGIVYDLVSLDCTAGSLMEYDFPSHMCLGWNIQCRDRMIKEGLANENTKFVLNHFSHNGGDAVYEDFEIIGKKYGFITSYDGLEIEF